MEKPKTKKLERRGQKWSREEEDSLLSEIAIMSIEDAAKIHKRTTGAIRSRLLSIAADMLKEGEDLEVVLKQTHVDPGTLEVFLEKKKSDDVRVRLPRNRPLLTNPNYTQHQLNRIEAKLDKIIAALNIDD